MSEEILRALMQLFAIIAKQDDGVSDAKNNYVKEFLATQINSDLVSEYFELYLSYFDEDGKEDKGKAKLTSVTDSVRILKICKQINKTLQQQQKVIVYVRLLEFLKSDASFTKQRLEIVETVAKVFRVAKDEIKSIENFILSDDINALVQDQDILVIGNVPEDQTESGMVMHIETIDSQILVLRAPSANLYFLRYDGKTPLSLNNKPVHPKRIYLWPAGGVIRPGHSRSIYYSDINTAFLSEENDFNLSFKAENISYTFKNGNIGVRPLDLVEKSGTLIGVMGASGAGKTTLMGILSGQTEPTTGSITINNIDLYKEKDKLEGVIGLVPQDDLLFEDLTVFENLYYSAKLSFKDVPDEELAARVDKVLLNLGLIDIKNHKVGSPLNKVISGGQRKRLNIALELIREPAVLFLDEPTSGLSSRDSENVMDLLRELSLKGKLVFVVIHQPSSTIFKLFDKLMVLDTGGYLIYEGNPVAGVSYFKKLDHQLHHGEGECVVCGNVNPESIFDIIESKEVDEYGNSTDRRKVQPKEWYAHFQKEREELEGERKEDSQEESDLHRTVKPGKLAQWVVFTIRDLKTKLSNRQYLIITLTEAPALAFFLSFILRYTSSPEETYWFSNNDNVPAYIFVSIIVATFLGLMVSSEEIIKDRKILKREQFLNLSKASYLFSKIGILFTISAIQAFMFTIIGNAMLEMNGNLFSYWFALFSVSAVANVLGLNISASFNSVVTIYILIPLIIIPQMVLSGAMFPFSRLNAIVGGGHNVPVMADVMPAKWAYEGAMTNQFKQNKYGELFYNLDRDISHYDFRLAHVVNELKKAAQRIAIIAKSSNGEVDEEKLTEVKNLALFIETQLNEERTIEQQVFQQYSIDTINLSDVEFLLSAFGAQKLLGHINSIEAAYEEVFNQAYNKKERVINALTADSVKSAMLRDYELRYFNKAVEEQVKNQASLIDAYDVIDNKVVQFSDPIYQKGEFTTGNGLSAPFFASEKGFFGITLSTYWFNMLVLWSMVLFLYIGLQFDLLSKLLNISNYIKLAKSK